MSSRPPLVFKFASEDWEFEQIHRLNYRTFVEEIPQHQSSPSHRLVDKFHSENTYVICLCDNTLAGMLAIRGRRPFSLDHKLADLDSYLPAGRNICEIRLLAVERKFRGAQVLQGMLALVWQHGVENGYDLAIISGTTRQFKLYHHLGFVPFGPLVGTGDAQFQPMYVTMETFEKTARQFLRSSPARSVQASAVNFLPGPVAVRRDVRRAFEQAPESHRSDSFIRDFQSAKQLLRELTGAANVELLAGSGTLANDVVGAQLSLEPQPGLVLSNGEFGSRLVDHSRRLGLRFDSIEKEWGEPFDLGRVAAKLEATRPGWLWCVHCETSTGVLNPLEDLKVLCHRFGVKLCLDCISSLGTVPVDLRGVYLASAASGKGLRAYPGVSMVFYNHPLPAASQPVPRYLDLSYYAANDGLPFTFSSNLLHALHAAVKRIDWPRRFEELAQTGAWLRATLVEMGFKLIGTKGVPAPAIVTIALAADLSSTEIGARLQESGYLLSYNSNYLRQKNWIQIAIMGESSREKLIAALNSLRRAGSVVLRSCEPLNPEPVRP